MPAHKGIYSAVGSGMRQTEQYQTSQRLLISFSSVGYVVPFVGTGNDQCLFGPATTHVRN